ncbi:hypothetical protein FGO68_gene16765 [Halteria grandinella]|uniref:Glucosidase II subunit alpha n=1 Tax=Halteria grandinella TaxID=5974 RepID=A0A8J8P216_HALGN|nr:hypothetical protein FGO68_gene16765 [Halteria grandinella]
MKGSIIVATGLLLISLVNASITGSDYRKNCEDQLFCKRFREISKHHVQDKKHMFSYDLTETHINKADSSVSGVLKLTAQSQFLQDSIGIKFQILKRGILHVVAADDNNFPERKSKRFRVSDFEGVEWANLQHDGEAAITSDQEEVLLATVQGYDYHTYRIKKSPFRIEYFINDTLLIESNNDNMMYFERKLPTEEQEQPFEFVDDALYEVIEPNLRYNLFRKETIDYEPYDFKESIGLSFKMHSQYLYGLPERADRLALKNTDHGLPYRLYNLDVFQHPPYNPQSLYGAIPYLTAHSDTFDASVVWMNSAETYVDIFLTKEAFEHDQETDLDALRSNWKEIHRRNTVWLSESGAMEFFLFGAANKNGNAPKQVMTKLTHLTGRLPLPPYYSFGFHYSKWEKITTQSMIDMVDTFNHHDLPLDILWMDIEYADDKRYFQFDSRFSDLDRFISKMKDEKKHITVITDPHIKMDDHFFVYKDGFDVEMVPKGGAREEAVKGVFMRDRDGQGTFYGECWPKTSVWVDFLNSNAQQYWSTLYQYSKFKGTTKLFSFWIDMNEPSVFSHDELTMPKDATHLTNDGRVFKHKDVHNAYGILMANATYTGIINREEDRNQRPFMLTRSVFFGSQKYGAMWTGDNQASNHFMALSIQMCLSLGLAGIPICGSDVGGFTGHASPKFLSKWYQHAVFMPFFRAHGHETVSQREPWFQGDQMYVMKEYLHLRHSLMPYIYTQTYFTTQTGIPLMRPLWMDFPGEFKTFGIDTNYMFGDCFFIAATYPQITDLRFYLPPSTDWYNFYTSEVQQVSNEARFIQVEQEEIGVFIKAGSIVPRKYMRRLSALSAKKDNYLLDIYPELRGDLVGQAQGYLYLDDGETFNHIKKKEYTLVEFNFDQDTLFFKVLNAQYTSGESFIVDEVNIFGLNQRPSQVRILSKTFVKDGKNVTFKYSQEEKRLEIIDLHLHLIEAPETTGGLALLKLEFDGSNGDL